MKKLLIFIVGLFLLTGCSKGEEFTCHVNGQDAIFTLNEGLVTSYKLGGQSKSQSDIDEINGEYFTSATNNEEGKAALKNYVSMQNGTCDF